MPCPAVDIEEHELPSLEAVLAGTLALMTGYSQALQAELDPGGRVAMGDKIGANLALLLDHPQLSAGFRRVLGSLRERWLAMGECTRAAAAGHERAAHAPRWALQAPKRLQ
jgi:hypothetical protein